MGVVPYEASGAGFWISSALNQCAPRANGVESLRSRIRSNLVPAASISLFQLTGAPKSTEDRLATEDEFGSEVFMNHFATSWAWALSAPFKGTKEDASPLGGTRDPLIISWPARIKQVRGLRSQFAHLNDIAPTLYDVAGITPPKVVNGVQQTPLEGTSLVYTFDHPDEPGHHHIQYFATSGNGPIYKDGWWAGDRLRLTW
jgi:arylsulfatase A-like enzyme